MKIAFVLCLVVIGGVLAEKTFKDGLKFNFLKLAGRNRRSTIDNSLRQAFNETDTNNDGLVDGGEMVAFMVKMKVPVDDNLKDMMINALGEGVGFAVFKQMAMQGMASQGK